MQVYRLVKGRRLTQLSFAFDTLDSGEVTLGVARRPTNSGNSRCTSFCIRPCRRESKETSVVAVKAMAEAAALPISRLGA